MWPVLDSLPGAWEQLHDVGVGHLVFVAAWLRNLERYMTSWRNGNLMRFGVSF